MGLPVSVLAWVELKALGMTDKSLLKALCVCTLLPQLGVVGVPEHKPSSNKVGAGLAEHSVGRPEDSKLGQFWNNFSDFPAVLQNPSGGSRRRWLV